MRILTRAELKMILNQLPLANKADTPDNAGVDLPQFILPSGEIIPKARLMFKKLQRKDFKGTVKWVWLYCGPLPYQDEEIIIEKENKKDLLPVVETERLVLPA